MYMSAFTALFAAVLVLADQCYYPDGTKSNDIPCNSSATHSSCCGSTAYCMSNGVCMNNGILSRGSCTDQNWDSDECCQYCRDYNTGGGYAMMPCTNTTFTCGFYPDKCSADSSLFTMKDAGSIVLRSDQLTSAMETAGVSIGSSSSSSDSDASATSASVVTVTANADGSVEAVSSDGGKEYTAGQMAGVGAGIGAPLLLAVGLLSWLLLREKKRAGMAKPDFQPLHSPEASSAHTGWAMWPSHNGQHQRVPTELSNEQVQEIDTPHRLAELDTKYRPHQMIS